MNKKTILLAGLILALVIVPIVAAAPALQQNKAQNGDTLQTQNRLCDQEQLQASECTPTCTNSPAEQNQLQTQTCANNCANNSAELQQAQEQLQTQEQTQQRLRNGVCNGTGTGVCNGTCAETQGQTLLQQRSCYGESNRAGNTTSGQYCYGYTYGCQRQQRNQVP